MLGEDMSKLYRSHVVGLLSGGPQWANGRASSELQGCLSRQLAEDLPAKARPTIDQTGIELDDGRSGRQLLAHIGRRTDPAHADDG